MLFQLPNNKTVYSVADEHRQTPLHVRTRTCPSKANPLRRQKSRPWPPVHSNRCGLGCNCYGFASKMGFVLKVNRTKSVVTALGWETTLPLTGPREMAFFKCTSVHSNCQGCQTLTATALPGSRSGVLSRGWSTRLPLAAANDGSRSVGNFLEKHTKVPESRSNRPMSSMPSTVGVAARFTSAIVCLLPSAQPV
jgi:hypothetical protein